MPINENWSEPEIYSRATTTKVHRFFHESGAVPLLIHFQKPPNYQFVFLLPNFLQKIFQNLLFLLRYRPIFNFLTSCSINFA